MALTERLAILIDAHAGGAIAEFKKVGVAAKGLDASVAGGTKSLGGLGKAGAAAGGLLKAGLVAGAASAGAAIVGFGVSSVKAFNDLAQEVLKFQRASGATAEEASALVAAFDDMGIEAETGSKAIFQLGKRLEVSADALAKYGITAVKNKAGNTDMAATLKSVADAYVKTTDPAKRAALVLAAFGKSGQDMIPILERGSAGIEALYAGAAATGQILSQEDIDKAEEFRIAMDDLGDAVREFSIEIGSGLVPALTNIANTVTDVIEKIKTLNDGLAQGRRNYDDFVEATADKAGGLGGAVRTLGAALTSGSVGGFVDTIIHGKDAMDKAKGSADGLADGIDGLGYSMEQVDPDEFDKSVDALTKTLFSAEAATRSLADAEESLSDAQQTLSDATDDYNKLLKEGAVDEEKVADARTSLAEATRSLADANRGVAKAQKEYDEAVANAAALGGLDSALDLVAEAGENLADAQDSQASASERAKDAADDLAKAQAGDPEFQKKLAAALEAREDATKGVADATYNLGKQSYENVLAHKAETEAISAKADEVERLKADLEAMLKLNPALFPFLGPLLAGLPASAAPTAAQIPLPPGIAGPVLPAFPGAPTTLAGPAAPVTTTNNVTVNATTSEPDARLIAKEVMWNLN